MLASLSGFDTFEINRLPAVYVTSEPLPWAALSLPLARAEDALARLDERLASSPIRAGWTTRTHFGP
jgi:hypothetical protein